MLRKLLGRARDHAWSERRDRETQDELALHLELLAAEKQRSGTDAALALRQARLELGNPEEVRETLREGRTGSSLDLLLKDAGYALRLLRKRPAWSAACLLTVALGVGRQHGPLRGGERGGAKAAAAPRSRLAREDLRLEPGQRRRADGDHERQPPGLAATDPQLPRASPATTRWGARSRSTASRRSCSRPR